MKKNAQMTEQSYTGLLGDVVELLEQARKVSVRSVNKIMTATYWAIGRRIVGQEEQGRKRAGYGEVLIERLAFDLTAGFGRGFSRSNLWQMRDFYSAWPIVQTPSAESGTTLPGSGNLQTLSGDLVGTKPAPVRIFLCRGRTMSACSR